MPSSAALMAGGIPWENGQKLGVEPLASATAAGTTQGTATALVSTFTNVTTSAINAGVILGDGQRRWFVYNTGPNTLTVYPPVGGTIVGLAVNAGVNLATASGVDLEGDGLNFLANFSI